VGGRVAYYRSIMRPKMSQRDLADTAHLSLGTIRKIEQGERGVGDSALEAIADALGVDPFLLLFGRSAPHTAVHAALPALSAALATQEIPEDGSVRPLRELRTDVDASVDWRLTAHYTRIARRLPDLLAELARARHQSTAPTVPHSRLCWSRHAARRTPPLSRWVPGICPPG
jgi:transcriptional regulator with XRE-family HTH domain